MNIRNKYQRRSRDYESPRTASLYYHPSGRMPLWGPPVMLLIGAIGTVIVAGMYGAVTCSIPCKPANAALAVVFAFVMGIVALGGYNAGKIRSPLAVLVFGTVIGLAALYVEWSAWASRFLDKTGGGERWLFAPGELADIILQAASRGMWPLKDPAPGSFAAMTVTGILMVFWALEALLVLALSAYVPYSDCYNSPFCEDCGAWAADKLKDLRLELPADPEMLRLDLEAGPVAALARLGPPGETAWLKVEVKACPKCQVRGWLKAEAVTAAPNPNGEPAETEEVVVNNLALGPEVGELAQTYLPPGVDGKEKVTE